MWCWKGIVAGSTEGFGLRAWQLAACRCTGSLERQPASLWYAHIPTPLDAEAECCCCISPPAPHCRLARAARMPRTGRRCWNACICGGRRRRATARGCLTASKAGVGFRAAGWWDLCAATKQQRAWRKPQGQVPAARPCLPPLRRAMPSRLTVLVRPRFLLHRRGGRHQEL